MLKRLITMVLGVGLSVSLLTPVVADGHTLSVVSSVNLAENGRGSVKHVVAMSGSNAVNLPSSATFKIYGSELKSLRARQTGGDNLKANFNQDKQTVEISIPEARRKSKASWSFTVSYEAKLLSDYGTTQALQLSDLDSNLSVTKQTLSVAADLELGFASVRGPKPSKTGIGVGQQIITFSDKDSELEHSPILIFGEAATANLNFNATLSNRSWWWKDVVLTLPPDTNQQKVQLNSIQPRPKNIKLDRDGNILAIYRLGPRQSVDVTALVQLTLSTFNYKFDQAANIKATDPILLERYTRLTDAWQPMDLAIEADGTEANKMVREVFDAVVKLAREDTADQQLQLATRGGALKYSDWLVGELRSRQVPARVVIGLLGSDGDRLLAKPMPHAWTEVYVNGTGWVTLDPWLSVRTGDFAGSDPLHIAISLWGIEEDRPPAQLDAVTVEFIDGEAQELPAVSEQVTLSATKYVWLPFVSVLSVNASFGPGTIIDDTFIKLSQQELALGSLAPQQTVRHGFARFGPVAFSSEAVALGQHGADGPVVWTEVKSQTSYQPLIIIVFISVLTVAVYWWRRRRTHGFKPSKESLTLHDEAEGGQIEEENLFGPPPHQRHSEPDHSASENATINRNAAAGPPRHLIQ